MEKKEIDEDENERVMEKVKATKGFESRKKILDIEEPVGMSAIKIPDAISARERIRNSRAETQRDSEIIEKGMTSSEGKESVRMSVRKIPDAISARERMRNTEANSHRDSETIKKEMISPEEKESFILSVRKIPDAISARERMRKARSETKSKYETIKKQLRKKEPILMSVRKIPDAFAAREKTRKARAEYEAVKRNAFEREVVDEVQAKHFVEESELSMEDKVINLYDNQSQEGSATVVGTMGKKQKDK